MGRVYGYVRISSRDQNEARQMAAMREAGVSDRDIYLDKRSGADFERQGYRQLLRRLRAGDRKSTRLNSSHRCTSRMPSSA